jgi:hypothetical protein
MSERAAIVNDTFHGKDVQLDGYNVMLTIKNVKESDFNVSYRLQLSYGQHFVPNTQEKDKQAKHTTQKIKKD